jgi:lipopolysaccharide export system permease protein
MKLLDRQVTRELIGPFLFGVAAFSSVFFAGSVLMKLTQWLMNGMPLMTALEIVLYSLPSIVFWTLPMATLLAVLMGVGRLSGESEIVALFAGGVSLYRIALPILGLGILVSGFSMLLNEKLAPMANARSANLQAKVLKQTAVSEQPFALEDKATNSRIMVQGGMDTDRGILRDVSIMQFAANRPHKNRPQLIVYAHRAEWAGLYDRTKRYRWKLYDGYTVAMNPSDPRTVGTTTFGNAGTKEIVIKTTPSEMSMFQLNSDQMSFSQLSRMVKYLRAHPDKSWNLPQLDVDRWNKIAVPLTSLVFALLAAPLGIRPQRSSSSVGFGLSILVIFLYWIVGRSTWALAVQGNITAAMGAFAPNIIGIVAAIVLLKRAAK